jgi:threonyl-tRNA synthetase
LTRVRSFAQDDAHIFCTPEQVQQEVHSVVEMILGCYGLFGFDVSIALSTRPADRAGDDALWDRAEAALRLALEGAGSTYTVRPGEGAFYGPKIDFIVRDALRREHQLGTIQLDYNLPERFDLRYIDAADHECRPVMIHRAMLGSLERFIGLLIEHTAGAFPFWLAPEQIRVLSITERTVPYARRVLEQLQDAQWRVAADVRNEKVGAKIRQGQLDKVPVLLVVGDREEAAGTVAVRTRAEGDLGPRPLSELLEQMRDWQDDKVLEARWIERSASEEREHA